MEKPKKKLKTSVIAAIIFFTLLLSVCFGVIGYRTYLSGMLQRYQNYEKAILNLTVSDFDWDSIEKCIEKQEEDEYFHKLRERMDHIKRNTDIAWLYMFEPLNANDVDNQRYVCTGNRPEEYEAYAAKGEKPVWLGKLNGSEVSADVAKKYLDFYQNSKEGEYWYYPNKTEWGYIYTTSIVVRNSSGKAIGIMSVDIYMEDIEKALRIYPLVTLLATIILSAIFILSLTLWLNRRIIKPLTQLQASASDFVSKANGLDVESLNFKNPDIETKDEIESLSNALLHMACETKGYVTKLLSETAEKERISADLNAAANIQASMLPHIMHVSPERTDYKLFASMNPAKEVGGDFYDFFFIDKTHLALVIADVSGKGIPAALFMVISKTIIKNSAVSGASLSPAKILEEANNQLCEGNSAGLFVTVWLGILDLESGIITAANAGHEYPAIRQPGEKFDFIKDKHGFVLAGMENSKYTDYQIKLEKGATIFVYTDGIPEATNANNELFELNRLKDALNINPDESPEELLQIVRKEVDKFIGDAPQFDDLTMLSLKYLG